MCRLEVTFISSVLFACRMFRYFSVSKPVEKPSGSDGSVVPVPRQRAGLTSTGDGASRSSVPPPRPTAMPRTKSDYNVGTSEPGSKVIRNQSDTDLEKKDVTSPPDPVDRPFQKPFTNDYSAANVKGTGASTVTSTNHSGEDLRQDSGKVRDTHTASLPPPTSSPPALPPGYGSRGPPPPLPTSRPVGVLPSANSSNMPAGNTAGISAPVPAARPDPSAGASVSGNPAVPVLAPRPDAAVGNSANQLAPVPTPRPDAAGAVPVPRRDNMANSSNAAAATAKMASSREKENETPYIPPRPKATPSAQPVTTASTSGPPVIPARSSVAVRPPVPSRSSIPPVIPPRQTNNS